MDTPDELWWDSQAGEYVLGTLRGTERDVFEKVLEVNVEAREKVRFWEKVFAVLDENVMEVDPPAYILTNIVARIRSTKLQTKPSGLVPERQQPGSQTTDSSSTNTTNAPRQIDSARRRRPSQRSNRIWKSIAGLATAASVALVALLVNNYSPVAQVDSIGVDSFTLIQNEDQMSLWIVNVNAKANSLQVIAIAPPEINSDQIHQLWIVKPNDAGVSSVGLLPQVAGGSVTLELTPEASDATLFAVSLEPQGGSPEPVPTGPVLFSGSAFFVKTSL